MSVTKTARRRILVPVTIAVFLCALQVRAVPRIEVAQPVWDFGAVTNLAQVAHTFEVRNTGDSDLVIEEIKSGCDSCLHARADKRRISPGQSASVYCQLDLRSIDGSVKRIVTVRSSDPKSRVVSLELRGESWPAFRVYPANIALDLSKGRTNELLEIKAVRPMRQSLSRVECDNTNIIAILFAKGPALWDLSVNVKDTVPRGTTKIVLYLTSGDPEDPVCEVRGTVRRPGNLEILPTGLRFAPKQGLQMRILWVKQHGDPPLRLLDAVCPTNDYQCEIAPGPDGRDYRILVTARNLENVIGRVGELSLKVADIDNVENFVSVPISVLQTD